MNSRPPHPGRVAVIIGIMLVIALIHAFRVGTYLEGRLFTLYYSYFGDIIIPFGIYFLLSINDSTLPFLADWRVKAVAVFVAATFTEVMQAFGFYALGVTYDPLDILMFAIGVLLAVILDRIIFARILPFWDVKHT